MDTHSRDLYDKIEQSLDRMKHAAINDNEAKDILLELKEIAKKINFEEEKVNYDEMLKAFENDDKKKFLNELKGIREHTRWLIDVKEEDMLTKADSQFFSILVKKEEVLVRILNYYSKKVGNEV